MARARNIKPSLFKNELLGTADPLLTILFTSLWCLADKRGRLEDRPLRIKAETFPYREGLDINGLLTELSRLDFIRRYKHDNIAIIQIVNFEKHQNPHHTEKESELPEYSKESTSCDLTVNVSLNNGYTPADSLLLIPDSLNADSLKPQTDSFIVTTDKSADTKKETELQLNCKATWLAYSNAYFDRYKTEPVRNAKINSQIKQFVQRIGGEESPYVAANYLKDNNSYYVQRLHSVDSLLADAEKLRTQWATGKNITQSRAKQFDRSQSNFDSIAEAKKILEGNHG